jgi:nucleotide-binding universal stress UspA family protein
MTVVVGFTPKPQGWAALTAAVDQARASGTRLVVVNSARGDTLVEDTWAADDDLARVGTELAASGLEHLLHRPVRGLDGADEVLAAAEEHGAELVVIGIRHRSAVGKLILGSDAQRILLGARCPVLAVKARDARESP